MLQTLLLTFREGVEALLIVAIALSYLRQTGRRQLVPVLHAAWLTAVIGSAVLGVILAQAGAMSSFWEGWLALIAGLLVLSCVWHIAAHGKRLASDIRSGIERRSQGSALGAALALFAFILLMVGREGIEMATMLATLAQAGDLSHMLYGGILGLALAGLLAWTWSRYGKRINLQLFFQVTALFMGLFAFQLAIYAFHEFSEAGVLPGLDNAWWHIATEPYGPEGEYGAWLTYSMAIVPMLFLSAVPLSRWWKNRRALALS